MQFTLLHFFLFLSHPFPPKRNVIYFNLFEIDFPWMNHNLNRLGLANWPACGQIHDHIFWECDVTIPSDIRKKSVSLYQKWLTNNSDEFYLQKLWPWKHFSTAEGFISIVCIIFSLCFSFLVVWRWFQNFWGMQKIFVTTKIHRFGF